MKSANSDNIVFGLVRNKAAAQELVKLESERANIHVLEADVVDYNALKVHTPE